MPSGKHLLRLAILKSFKVFFREKIHLFSQRKPQVLNVLRILIIPVTFYSELATN